MWNKKVDLVSDYPTSEESEQSGEGIFSSNVWKIIITTTVVCLVGAAFTIPATIILINTTISSTTLTTSTTSTSTTTSVTTTTAPASSMCVGTSGGRLDNNQFIYSPSQLFAAGIMNNQFAIYRAYSHLNVTTNRTWTAGQSSTSQTNYLALQSDRNLVIYTVTGGAVQWASNTNNGGSGVPFCLQLLDSGNMIWKDSSSTIIWQTYSVQTG